jgi:arylformamidase
MNPSLTGQFRIIDISVTIRENMPIYPDDREFSIRAETTVEGGDSSQVSRIEMGSHTGTHLDFPNHFIAGGKSSRDFGPERFILEAQVVETAGDGNVCAADLDGIEPDSGRAILFKTENSRNKLFASDSFQKSYVGIGADAARILLGLRTPLVGIDYLSIDPYNSETYPSHNILLPNEVILLEGIDLSEVSPGLYTLVCLPLRFDNSVASPVRAVLIDTLQK